MGHAVLSDDEYGERLIRMTNMQVALHQISKHGRDRYPTVQRQFIKLVEEVGEIGKELNRAEQKPGRIRAEIGDAFLALYNLCFKIGVDPETEMRWIVKADDRKF